jgi:hypothetical protein
MMKWNPAIPIAKTRQEGIHSQFQHKSKMHSHEQVDQQHRDKGLKIT